MLLLPIVVVVVVCVLNCRLASLAISVGCGVLFGAVFQGITNVSDIFNILHYGTTFESSNELANNLLTAAAWITRCGPINLILLAVPTAERWNGAAVSKHFSAVSRVKSTMWEVWLY